MERSAAQWNVGPRASLIFVMPKGGHDEPGTPLMNVTVKIKKTVVKKCRKAYVVNIVKKWIKLSVCS